MQINFDTSCGFCEARPACELGARKAAELEKQARKLGHTVIEGSLSCSGRDRLPEPWETFQCSAQFIAPQLASDDERDRISRLAELDERLKAVWPEVNKNAREVLPQES